MRARDRFAFGLSGLADNALALEMMEGRSSLVDAFRRSIGYGHGRLELVHKHLPGAEIEMEVGESATMVRVASAMSSAAFQPLSRFGSSLIKLIPT